MLALLVLTIKMYEISNFENSFYAQVGGISLCEFNQMEVVLLQIMGFKPMVGVDEFQLMRDWLDNW